MPTGVYPRKKTSKVHSLPYFKDVLNPVEGTIARGRKGNIWAKQIYTKCIRCGNGKWSRLVNEVPRDPSCCRPKGMESANWKGGRHDEHHGYIKITVPRNDPYVSMAPKDAGFRILEHRYVMAKSLGRCLETWEVVHHKNGNKKDNRIENLELINKFEHDTITLLTEEIKRLRKEISDLKCIISGGKTT